MNNHITAGWASSYRCITTSYFLRTSLTSNMFWDDPTLKWRGIERAPASFWCNCWVSLFRGFTVIYQVNLPGNLTWFTRKNQMIGGGYWQLNLPLVMPALHRSQRPCSAGEPQDAAVRSLEIWPWNRALRVKLRVKPGRILLKTMRFLQKSWVKLGWSHSMPLRWVYHGGDGLIDPWRLGWFTAGSWYIRSDLPCR